MVARASKLPNRSRNCHLVVRLSKEERDEVRAIANHDRLDISDVVRQWIRKRYLEILPSNSDDT